MKGILLAIVLVSQLCAIAQHKLSIKAGFEYGYKEFDGLTISKDDYSESYPFAYDVGFVPFRTLQLGGRFGTEQAYEAGIGLAFGTIQFEGFETVDPKSEIVRKSIYMERYYSSSGNWTFGTGSQLYTYKMTLEKEFDNFSELSDNGFASATWKSTGLEWRIMARLYFGERETHSLMAFVGLSGEAVKIEKFTLNDYATPYLDEPLLTLGAQFGITYACVINAAK